MPETGMSGQLTRSLRIHVQREGRNNFSPVLKITVQIKNAQAEHKWIRVETRSPGNTRVQNLQQLRTESECQMTTKHPK